MTRRKLALFERSLLLPALLDALGSFHQGCSGATR